MSGTLVKGAQLPPTRSFAQELGVSRSTVVTAYDQLTAEGYIDGRQGSGYRVCGMQTVEMTPPKPAPSHTTSLPPAEPSHPFMSGNPDMRLFPFRAWAKTVARIGRQTPEDLLISQSLQGHPDLRSTIATHVHEWRGVSAQPEQIFVTAGSIEALELCLRVLSEPGDAVALENPGYQPMRRQVEAQGLRPIDMPLDDQGALVPDDHARLAVLTPSHQFPLGGTMSPARRQAFLGWARALDGWIIEDDYDSEFRFAGHPIPALAGFDGLDRTIYVGSFSKIFSAGLRLGYVIVPFSLRDQFAEVLTQFGGKASIMPQAPLAAFMQSGEFYRHLRRVRRHYARRRNYLMERLARDFADIGTFTDHQAGMQIVLHLKPSLKDTEIAKRAQSQKIALGALSEYYSGAMAGNGLIFGYCGFEEAEMGEALAQLRAIIETQHQ